MAEADPEQESVIPGRTRSFPVHGEIVADVALIRNGNGGLICLM